MSNANRGLSSPRLSKIAPKKDALVFLIPLLLIVLLATSAAFVFPNNSVSLWERVLEVTADSGYSMGFAAVSVAVFGVLLFESRDSSDGPETSIDNDQVIILKDFLTDAWAKIYLLYTSVNALVLGCWLKALLYEKPSFPEHIKYPIAALLTISLGLAIITGLYLCIQCFSPKFSKVQEAAYKESLSGLEEKLLRPDDLKKEKWWIAPTVLLALGILIWISVWHFSNKSRVLDNTALMAWELLGSMSLFSAFTCWGFAFIQIRSFKRTVMEGGFFTCTKTRKGNIHSLKAKADSLHNVYISTLGWFILVGAQSVIILAAPMINSLLSGSLLRWETITALIASMLLVIFALVIAYKKPVYGYRCYARIVAQSAENWSALAYPAEIN